jgi:Nucleotidyltransferase domain
VILVPGRPRDNRGREEDRQITSGPAFLGQLRDRLLDQVLGQLKADPSVDGVALIGSLGRGEADNWSDIDLLILMGDQALARFVDEPAAWPWAQADLLSDGRHNSPAGATSVGTIRVRSGLPFSVDLHVHPSARTLWPADGRVVFERRPIETGTLSFDQLNASGSRQTATAKTADEIRRIHLSYVPIAGKYVARRSPQACQMIRFLGKVPDFSACDPSAQLLALRSVAGNLSDPSWTWLSDAVTSYLELVEASL